MLSLIIQLLTALGIALKDKTGLTITNKIKKTWDKSTHKLNKIWVDKVSEFYNRSSKSWVEKNAIEMYSVIIEGNSVVAERFMRTLKNEIYKYMT